MIYRLLSLSRLTTVTAHHVCLPTAPLPLSGHCLPAWMPGHRPCHQYTLLTPLRCHTPAGWAAQPRCQRRRCLCLPQPLLFNFPAVTATGQHCRVACLPVTQPLPWQASCLLPTLPAACLLLLSAAHKATLATGQLLLPACHTTACLPACQLPACLPACPLPVNGVTCPLQASPSHHATTTQPGCLPAHPVCHTAAAAGCLAGRAWPARLSAVTLLPASMSHKAWLSVTTTFSSTTQLPTQLSLPAAAAHCCCCCCHCYTRIYLYLFIFLFRFRRRFCYIYYMFACFECFCSPSEHVVL